VQAVKDALAAFQSMADLPESAFGKRPESGQLWSEYKKFHSQVVNDVGQLADALTSGAVKLHLSAGGYRAADRAATVRDA
jgi:cytochrome c556